LVPRRELRRLRQHGRSIVRLRRPRTALLSMVLSAIACQQQPARPAVAAATPAPAVAAPSPAPPAAGVRYQIVWNPGQAGYVPTVGGDRVFLLDTETGRVWRYMSFTDGFPVWMLVERIDDENEVRRWEQNTFPPTHTKR
jgi:hypothetical protein